MPESFSVRGGTHNFDRDGRYAVIFYETHRDIDEIGEYLIGYQARHRRVLDVQRQRLVHPFGDVDHFALMYRHHTPFNEWLGVTPKVARYRWRIPDRLRLGGIPVFIDCPDFPAFLREIEHRRDAGPRAMFEDEFQADVDELGFTRIVVGAGDFYLESDYSEPSIEWLTKWTLLKLRWT